MSLKYSFAHMHQKGPRRGRTCTQVSQAWSSLVWSDHKALRQPVTDHVNAEQHSELMLKVALVPSPLSYQFLSSHSLLLFIALQLICSVLNGAEQTWVS